MAMVSDLLRPDYPACHSRRSLRRQRDGTITTTQTGTSGTAAKKAAGRNRRPPQRTAHRQTATATATSASRPHCPATQTDCGTPPRPSTLAQTANPSTPNGYWPHLPPSSQSFATGRHPVKFLAAGTSNATANSSSKCASPRLPHDRDEEVNQSRPTGHCPANPRASPWDLWQCPAHLPSLTRISYFVFHISGDPMTTYITIAVHSGGEGKTAPPSISPTAYHEMEAVHYWSFRQPRRRQHLSRLRPRALRL